MFYLASAFVKHLQAVVHPAELSTIPAAPAYFLLPPQAVCCTTRPTCLLRWSTRLELNPLPCLHLCGPTLLKRQAPSPG